MKKSSIVIILFVATMFSWAMIPDSVGNAGEILKYSCSAQIREAFGQESLDAFAKETGTEVEVYVSSSGSAVYRLMNGFSDIASTTRGLYYRQRESGYVETPFCRDPLAIITNVSCPVKNISEQQLRDIFSGTITNWKELGGPNQPVVVFIPGKNTAAYKNFERQAMKHEEIKYDYMTFQSTMVIEGVKNFPWSISFISLGAQTTMGTTKTLKVNNIDPTDKDYPYYQIFSFVTKGKPVGDAKKFIDFALSDKGIKLMKKKGMLPVK
ncbi:substrate-binding domain-containing protein [Desulfonema magnum]|uniref:PBM domain-containing protein n=1 Tax=Desulfonema magnum TaxID=45655 RepID=A0A975BMS1_9BACT|nr:substrate-binding domain-containing protein [Desulfonema magnum]QTA88579.1 PBM domain-containing protein [Desulfonema magnum]